MNKAILIPGAALALAALAGCLPAQEHARAVQTASPGGLSVGAVQQQIRVGMTGGQVAAAVGAPNVVTTDELRREVWIYDRMATDQVYSTSNGGLGLVMFPGGGGIGPFGTYQSGARSTSQRTLTVLVKFDETGRVRDFAYHQGRF